MPTQLYTFGTDDSFTGTTADDFILAFSFHATEDEYLDGGDGDDFILGDSSNTYLVGTANSFATAFDLDQSTSYWTTDENPFFGDSSIPHTSLYVRAAAGETLYSSVTVGAGETITVDIDFGYSFPIGTDTDLVVELYDSSGALVAIRDSENSSAFDEGSLSTNHDPFLSITNTTGTAQTYTIRFLEFNTGDGGVFDGGETFVANISVTGHAVTAPTIMGNDEIWGGLGDDTLAGQGGDDSLYGDGGNDTLIGGSGDDLLSGGDGFDRASYADAPSAVIVNLNLAGAQNTGGAGTDTLSGIEQVSGSRFNDVLTGTVGDNGLYGADGDDLLIGGLGDDLLHGGGGIDTVSYAAASAGVTVTLHTLGSQDTGAAGFDTLQQVENLTGSPFDDQLTGTYGDTVLLGGAGDDILDGGGVFGNDLLHGGDGSDTASYAQAGIGVLVSLGDSGPQAIGGLLVQTLLSIENLSGSPYYDMLIGDAGANTISGHGGDDRLFGGAGADNLLGGDGSDTLEGEDGADVLDGGADGDFLLGGAGDDALFGGDGWDRIMGDDGDDVLFGQAGSDVLRGGEGNDTLHGGVGDDQLDGNGGVDTASYETASAGVSVDLSITDPQRTEGAGWETLTSIENLLGSTHDDVLTGNSDANTIRGLNGNDRLNGGDGNDMLDGGEGDDALDGGDGTDTASYATAAAAVTVTLASAAAQDTVGAGIDTLSNIEDLLGSAYDDSLTGSSGANKLEGGSGNDRLDGGLGSDWAMYSSAGAGVTVDLSVTTAQDTLGAGVDTLASIANLAGSEFADTLTGDAANNRLYGDGGDDLLVGGLGNDRLSGGAGADAMSAGAGNDIYVVDSAGDVVSEATAEGSDVVWSSISYTLTANVERLTLTGSAAIDGTGNALSNVLRGNAAANRLDGGAGHDSFFAMGGDDVLVGGLGYDRLNGGTGADTMAGGAGNDIYVVENAGDLVTEAAGEGGDLVWSSISYTLTANVERLTLTGSAAIDGTGNELNNLIRGNGAGNRLDGAGGNDRIIGMGAGDTLIGGDGNDVLSGGAGPDAFLFNAALNASTNVDRIGDFSVADDTILLDDDVFTAVGAIGTLSTSAFRTGTAAQDADDRIIYDSATGKIYYDADGNGAGAQVLFAQITAGLALTSADFLIVG